MTIPKEATLVFKGVIFDVYQWEQVMFDGSKATFEALKRPDTVIILPSANEKIFISYEEQPHYTRKYTLLGGRVEKDEDPLVAAKRELLEEAGMIAQEWELCKKYSVGGEVEWNLYFYFARDCKKIAEQNLDPGEKIDVKAVTFDEFINLVTAESFGEIQFANDIFRMKENNELPKFKEKLLSL